MRSTAAAYILLPVVFVTCSVLWGVLMKPLAALAILLLFIAWNVWSGARAQREKTVKESPVAGGSQ